MNLEHRVKEMEDTIGLLVKFIETQKIVNEEYLSVIKKNTENIIDLNESLNDSMNNANTFYDNQNNINGSNQRMYDMFTSWMEKTNEDIDVVYKALSNIIS